MMDDYIDRESLIKAMDRKIEQLIVRMQDGEDLAEFRRGFSFGSEFVKTEPAADVAPVVRCKDCKHSNPEGCYEPFAWCDYFNIGIVDRNSHYCARGQKWMEVNDETAF